DEIAVDEAYPPAASESGELAFKLLRRPEVVAIQDGDELAASLADTTIPGGGLSKSRRLDDPELLNLAGKLFQHDFRRISRTVVDDDDLSNDIESRLSFHAANGLFDRGLLVMARHYYGHAHETSPAKRSAGAER